MPAVHLTDEMKQYVNPARFESSPCLLTTAGKDGWPSLGFRGSLMVFDETHLAYWERSKKDGLAHILENPNVLVFYRNTNAKLDPPVRIMWKFYGRAKVHENDSVREEVMKRTHQIELDADPEHKGVAVLIEVDAVQDARGQVIMSRDGVKIPGVVM